MTERLCRDMYSELIVKGYRTPDIRSRVIDSDFGGAGVCSPPVASSVDCSSDGSGCADGSGVRSWGDISVVEIAGASSGEAPGGIEEATSVVEVIAEVGLPDFSSVLDAIVSVAGNMLELASPLGVVDISGAVVLEMSLAMVAAVAIFIREEYAVCVPSVRMKNVIDVMHRHVNVVW